MAFSSVEGLLQVAGQVPLWRAVLEDDLRERGVDEAHSWRQMAALWTAMKAPVAEYDPAARSRSGLTGGAGARLEGEGPGLCPPFLRQVIAAALKTGECNACMKRIVAAPTAGASGVLPAVLLPLQARDGLDDRRMVEALYVAAGFGQVIATRASISGAEGGCQAEVGSASGMAAAALVHVMGGTPGQMAHACAMALSNTLGLVCDPVAGLVEVPCVNRNVMGAVNALSCAEMALSGVESAIPCDEVIDAMREVGEKMDVSLRETGIGGALCAPTKPKKRGKTMLQFNHFNFNVLDLERSLAFYRQALELEVAEEKEAGDGSFKLVYLGDGETGFRLELTWLRDRTEPYDLGEQEFHLAFVTDRFDALLARHRAMGCVCFENPDMGVYFIEDPDGYWIELVPERG